eukprot:5243858-Pleurochrysis_carterae.AAC.2
MVCIRTHEDRRCDKHAGRCAACSVRSTYCPSLEPATPMVLSAVLSFLSLSLSLSLPPCLCSTSSLPPPAP